MFLWLLNFSICLEGNRERQNLIHLSYHSCISFFALLGKLFNLTVRGSSFPLSWNGVQVLLIQTSVRGGRTSVKYWIFTDDRTAWKRNVYTAIIAADGKPCLVVYFKKHDEDDGQVKQKMTMFLPKSCEGIEFPVQDLTGFFPCLLVWRGI